jgi:hypothetical protein
MSNTLLPILKETVNPAVNELVQAHIDWAKDNLIYQKPIKIQSEEEFVKLMNKLDYAKKANNLIDERRLEITAPIRDIVKKIDESIKTSLIKPLEAIKIGLTKSVTEYKAEQIKIQREEEAKKRKEAEALAEAAKKKLEEAGRLTEEKAKDLDNLVEKAVQIADIPEANKKVSTAMGSVSITSRFVFDKEKSNLLELCKAIVANPGLLKYITFDEVAVNKDLKPTKEKTPEKIAGIEFEEVFGTRSL